MNMPILPNPAIRKHTVWEGRPGWRGLAFGLFRMHLVALYFGLLAVGRTGLALWHGDKLAHAWPPSVAVLMLGAICLGLLTLLTWAVRRTTRYSMTDRRIILRYGVALPAKLAIPCGAVAEVALRIGRGRLRGSGGDVSIRLKPGQAMGYMQLWPHAQPWRIAAPEPMLRALPDAAVVGAILVRLTKSGVAWLAAVEMSLGATPAFERVDAVAG